MFYFEKQAIKIMLKAKINKKQLYKDMSSFLNGGASSLHPNGAEKAKSFTGALMNQTLVVVVVFFVFFSQSKEPFLSPLKELI